MALRGSNVPSLRSPAEQLGVDGALLLGALQADARHATALVELVRPQLIEELTGGVAFPVRVNRGNLLSQYSVAVRESIDLPILPDLHCLGRSSSLGGNCNSPAVGIRAPVAVDGLLHEGPHGGQRTQRGAHVSDQQLHRR